MAEIKYDEINEKAYADAEKHKPGSDTTVVELPNSYDRDIVEAVNVLCDSLCAEDVDPGKTAEEALAFLGTLLVEPMTLVQKSITENGVYDPADDEADGYSSVVVDIPGLPNNFVFGSFTTLNTTYAAHWVDIPYNGDGYPKFLMIFDEQGLRNNGNYAIDVYCVSKTYTDTRPDYTSGGSRNQTTIACIHGDSNNTIAAKTSTYSYLYSSSGSVAGTAAGSVLLIRNDKAFQIFLKKNANNTYGFLNSHKYCYLAVYEEA